MAFGTLIIWSIVVLSYIISAIFGQGTNSNYAIYYGISIFVYLIWYKSLTQPEVYIVDAERSDSIESDKTFKSYKKSGLSEDKADDYLQRLITLFLKHCPSSNNSISSISKSSTVICSCVYNLWL